MVIAAPNTCPSTISQADCDALLGTWVNWVAGGGQCSSSSSSISIPAGTLPSFIPEPYNGAFTQGATKHNVAPAYIAAFFSAEHNLGNGYPNPDTASLPKAWATFIKNHPDPNSGWDASSVGAQGPFQFLPSTWQGYGYDIKDINNLVIAADAAGKYAESNGATKDASEEKLRSFASAYGGTSADYAAAVMAYYRYYNGAPASTPADGSALITVSSTASCTGGNGIVAGNITQTAVGLAWPEPFENKPASEDRDSANTPTPAYVAAMKQYNKAGFGMTNGLGNDCGVFVATVLHASGADPNYPDSYTVAQAEYVINHPEKYQVIYPVTSTADLKPGDILILNQGTTKDATGKIHIGAGAGGAGHTMVYVGNQAHGYTQASASLGSRSGNLGFTQLADSRGQYLIARLK